jgi:hypothetical protein
MLRRSAVLFGTLLLSAFLGTPHGAAAEETLASVGAGGIYPPGTTLNGVPVNALQLGLGVEVNAETSASGQLCAVLLGVSALGVEQNIVIEGQATNGSRNGPNVVVFSGTASLDMGDATPPVSGVPFTATVTTDDNGQGTVGLVLGLTTLPSASLNAGSMWIE